MVKEQPHEGQIYTNNIKALIKKKSPNSIHINMKI